MIRKLTEIPAAALHYSLGTFVLVTHLVTVAVQDRRYGLRA